MRQKNLGLLWWPTLAKRIEDDLKELPLLQASLPKEVYEALLVDHSLLDASFHKRLKALRYELNTKQSAWAKLHKETDLEILTGERIIAIQLLAFLNFWPP